jgi:hypothetical protein
MANDTTSGGDAARGREAAAVRQVGCCELRQPAGQEEVEAKLQGGFSDGATTGATRQPAGKQEANGRRGFQEANGKREVRCQRTRGDGASIG